MATGVRQKQNRFYCSISKLQPLLLAAAMLLTAACQPRLDSTLNDYQQRLERVLAIGDAASTSPQTPRLPLPAVRTLVKPIPSFTIGLSDMLSLQVCQLDTLIGERNNILGKVQTDSTLLRYELKLLVALKHCLQTTELASQLEPELRTDLQQIYRQKQQQLPQIFANMLSGDETLRQQIFGSQRSIAPDQGGLAETLQALQQLSTLRRLIASQQYLAASQIDINQALAALHRSQLLADLQHSVQLALQFFTALNQQLAALPDAQLCKTDNTVRNNILEQIFIGRVQPELARLDGMSTELGPAWLAVYQEHPLAETIVQRFQQPQSALQTELRQHVSFWQRWRQCAPAIARSSGL